MEIQKIFIIVTPVYSRVNFTILGFRSQYFFYLMDAYFWSYPNDFSTYTDNVIIPLERMGNFANAGYIDFNLGVVPSIYL